MYAVIETGGKQYKVEKGDTIKIELFDAEKDITFSNVLLVVDDGKVEIGTPYVAQAKVKAKVIEHGKADKVIVFKYKNKINYRRKRGHRQPFTKVQIEDIKIGG